MESHRALASPPPRSEGLAFLFNPNKQRGAPEEPRIEEIRFHQLKSARDIAQVLHLREELSLPLAIRTDPEFAAREKKETTRVLSELLCGKRTALAPYAWSPSNRA